MLANVFTTLLPAPKTLFLTFRGTGSVVTRQHLLNSFAVSIGREGASTHLFRSARRRVEPRSRRLRRFTAVLAPLPHAHATHVARQTPASSRCKRCWPFARCWPTRLKGAFAAQTVSFIVRVGRAASACVLHSRAGVAGFVREAARLSLAGERSWARPPSFKRLHPFQQVCKACYFGALI